LPAQHRLPRGANWPAIEKGGVPGRRLFDSGIGPRAYRIRRWHWPAFQPAPIRRREPIDGRHHLCARETQQFFLAASRPFRGRIVPLRGRSSH